MIAIDPAERIREKLAATIEALNAATDPAERVSLFGDIESLRSQLRASEITPQGNLS